MVVAGADFCDRRTETLDGHGHEVLVVRAVTELSHVVGAPAPSGPVLEYCAALVDSDAEGDDA